MSDNDYRLDMNVFEPARQHGLDSDPDHEVGDLQDALTLAWSIMDENQRKKFLAEHKQICWAD